MLDIPEFRDGRVLKAEHLYRLVTLSLDGLRLALAADGSARFIRHPAFDAEEWNQFTVENDQLVIHPLAAVNCKGNPFITTTKQSLPLGDGHLFAYAPVVDANQQRYEVAAFEWLVTDAPADQEAAGRPWLRLGSAKRNRFEVALSAMRLSDSSALRRLAADLREAARDLHRALALKGPRFGVPYERLLTQVERFVMAGDAWELSAFAVESRLLITLATAFLDDVKRPIADELNVLGAMAVDRALAPTGLTDELVLLNGVLEQLSKDGSLWKALEGWGREVSMAKGYPKPDVARRKICGYDLTNGGGTAPMSVMVEFSQDPGDLFFWSGDHDPNSASPRTWTSMRSLRVQDTANAFAYRIEGLAPEHLLEILVPAGVTPALYLEESIP